jgi:hypothetical protein
MAGRSINKIRPGFALALILLACGSGEGNAQQRQLVAGPVLAPALALQSPLAEQMRQDPGACEPVHYIQRHPGAVDARECPGRV